MRHVELVPVDADNVYELLKLSVDESQRAFVATNAESLAEAYATEKSGGTALPFGIRADGAYVGFLMIGYDCQDWPDAPAIARGTYSVWRLMIDARRQGEGLGRAALREAVAYVRTLPCGPSPLVWLSYEPENEVARRLYLSEGFTETGELDGTEVIAARAL